MEPSVTAGGFIPLHFQETALFLTARIEVFRDGMVYTGTGFFYVEMLDDTSGRIFLVSNKHVLIEDYDQLTISCASAMAGTNGSVPDLNGTGGTISFRRSDSVSYHCHPDSRIDLACINISLEFKAVRDQLYLRWMTSEGVVENWDRSPVGSDVYFIGYPNGRYDKTHNLPLVRRGSIASLPKVDFDGMPQYVIDAHVHGGSSGSPVFVQINNEAQFAGVVFAAIIRNDRLVPATAAAETQELALGIEITTALGLGLVLKPHLVIELIESAINSDTSNQEIS